jgi:hypothetical protein
VEEELHHVILGEELGDWSELIGADLFPGPVDLVFALGLPELVGPAESVIGSESFRREGCEHFALFYLVVDCNGEIEYWVIPPENAGECEAGESAGEIEAITGGEIRGEFFAFLQSHGNGAVGLIRDEKVILGEETGEEQTVPMLVGGQFAEVANVLNAGTFVALIPEGTATRAETIAEQALLDAHVGTVFLFVNGKVFQRSPTGRLGQDAGVVGGLFEELAEFLGE